MNSVHAWIVIVRTSAAGVSLSRRDRMSASQYLLLLDPAGFCATAPTPSSRRICSIVRMGGGVATSGAVAPKPASGQVCRSNLGEEFCGKPSGARGSAAELSGDEGATRVSCVSATAEAPFLSWSGLALTVGRPSRWPAAVQMDGP